MNVKKEITMDVKVEEGVHVMNVKKEIRMEEGVQAVVTSDGVRVDVDYDVFSQFRAFAGRCRSNKRIVLEDVTSGALEKVVEYTKKHAFNSADDPNIKAWDLHFINTVSNSHIADLLTAAFYLGVNGLRHLTAKAIAQRSEGVTNLRLIYC